MRLTQILVLGLSALTLGLASAAESTRNQVVLLEPVAMMLINGVGDMSVVSLGYERKIPGTPYSAQVHFHGGYSASGNEDYVEGDTSWALGGGLTLRRYFGNSFEGSFGQVQSDYVQGESVYRPYYDPYYSQVPPSVLSEKLYWSTQVSIGYKWQWDAFVAEGSVGGALYFSHLEKYTNLSASFNLGAPF